jgi:hypothetical protein
LIGWIFGPDNWVYGVVGYLLMLAACAGVIRTPRRYQRPVAFLLTVLVIVYLPSFLHAPSGFEWLMPILFLKLVAGHAVRPELLPEIAPAERDKRLQRRK